MMGANLTETLLIVDYSGKIRQEISDQLRSLNYVVLVTSTKDEFLRYFRDGNPSMIFFDGNAPEHEGEEILQTIRDEAPETPVIIIAEAETFPESFGSILTDSYPLIARPVVPAVLKHSLRHVQYSMHLNQTAYKHGWALEQRKTELEVHTNMLERQNLKLQREHKELTKTCSRYRNEIKTHGKVEQHLDTVQLAIETASDLVLILNQQGGIDYCNEAFKKMFQVTEAQETFPLETLFVDTSMADSINTNVDTLGNFSCEVPMRSKENTDFPAHVNANVIEDMDGVRRGILYIIADISEQEQLRQEAYYDALTGLYTRRHFLELLSSNASLALRHQHSLSLCLCDLDKFKQVNDTYGHRLGDAVLKAFSKVVTEEMRNEDIPGRIGGDEFILMFPHVEASIAAVCVERIRKRFESITFTTEDGTEFNCSVTMGIADYPATEISVEQFMELADQSLYKAKENGRNCSVVNMDLVKAAIA